MVKTIQFLEKPLAANFIGLAPCLISSVLSIFVWSQYAYVRQHLGKNELLIFEIPYATSMVYKFSSYSRYVRPKT